MIDTAIQKEAKTIKSIAQETAILEPNVRRILGQGVKAGIFQRIQRGVYILSVGEKDIAYIQPGNAVEKLPELADRGLKADMVFLDIPYNTPAVRGGNRGIKYKTISVREFETVVDALGKILRTDDSLLYHMFSRARSGLKAMERYNEVLYDKGFKVLGVGDYYKYYSDGVSRVTNMRGDIIQPEGILLLNKSGVVPADVQLNFHLVRPGGYQTEKPAEMLRQLIKQSTKENDIVLDPFAGSGVTLAEGARLKRRVVGIELLENVIETIIIPRVMRALSCSLL